MDKLFMLLFFAGFILLIIGLFSPQSSLFWYKKERTRKRSAQIYGIGIFILLFLIGATANPKEKVTRESDTRQEFLKAEKSKPVEPPKTQAELASIAKAELKS